MNDQNDQSERDDANAKRVKDAHHDALLRVTDDVQSVLAFMRTNPAAEGQVLPMEVLSLFSTLANMMNTLMLSQLAEAIRDAGAMASMGGLMGGIGGGLDGLLASVGRKVSEHVAAKRGDKKDEG